VPRTSGRGGAQTRDRIAAIASGLFVEHGFEAVTVADVASAAGVSSVTVFKYFPKKEDLFFDRSDEAVSVLCEAVREAAGRGGITQSLRGLLVRLIDERHPFSGTDPRSVPFFRTMSQSATLLARARQIASELQDILELELGSSPEFTGDPGLLAAFFVAGYARILTGTARRLVKGEPDEALVRRHRDQVELLLSGLRHGVLRPVLPGQEPTP
jgi:AcrR family transcriptional regulator